MHSLKYTEYSCILYRVWHFLQSYSVQLHNPLNTVYIIQWRFALYTQNGLRGSPRSQSHSKPTLVMILKVLKYSFGTKSYFHMTYICHISHKHTKHLRSKVWQKKAKTENIKLGNFFYTEKLMRPVLIILVFKSHFLNNMTSNSYSTSMFFFAISKGIYRPYILKKPNMHMNPI